MKAKITSVMSMSSRPGISGKSISWRRQLARVPVYKTTRFEGKRLTMDITIPAKPPLSGLLTALRPLRVTEVGPRAGCAWLAIPAANLRWHGR